jgi:hypothetical protein
MVLICSLPMRYERDPLWQEPFNAASLVLPPVLDSCFVLLGKLAEPAGAASSSRSGGSSFGSGATTRSRRELVSARGRVAVPQSVALHAWVCSRCVPCVDMLHARLWCTPHCANATTATAAAIKQKKGAVSAAGGLWLGATRRWPAVILPHARGFRFSQPRVTPTVTPTPDGSVPRVTPAVTPTPGGPGPSGCPLLLPTLLPPSA